MAGTGDYNLPDAFGGLLGDLTFDADHNYRPIQATGEGQIRDLRSRGTPDGIPRWCAVRWKADPGTGQRAEILLHPTPDAVYTLTYKYSLHPNALTGTQYPAGGEAHADTISAACKAAAELHINDQRGVHYENFIERLRASIAYDVRNFEPQLYGYNGDRSTSGSELCRSRALRVSYDGVFY